MKMYVAPDGNDANPGSLKQPFRTLAKAAAALQPGDTCILRGGVYREVLRPGCSGTAAQPIVFQAADGEAPMISGADLLTGWQAETGGLWSAAMSWDLADQNQLFADGLSHAQR